MKRLTLGCDPEFMILTQEDKPIPAYLVCDDDNHANPFGIEIGQEQYIFELRPKPAEDVFTIIARIRKLLEININKVPHLKKYKFISGHIVRTSNRNFKIGGHIHIGSKEYEVRNDYLQSDKFEDFINKIIYHGLMNVINDKEGHKARQRSPLPYGKCGHFVYQDYGIEYKTPPSWLVNPTLAFVFLTLAKICGLMFCNKDFWGIENDVEAITHSKDKGLIILKKLLALTKAQPEMMEENDIAHCIDLIDKLPKIIKVTSWQQDFKKAWQL